MFLTNNSNLCESQGGQYSEDYILKLDGYDFESCNNNVSDFGCSVNPNARLG